MKVVRYLGSSHDTNVKCVQKHGQKSLRKIPSWRFKHNKGDKLKWLTELVAGVPY